MSDASQKQLYAVTLDGLFVKYCSLVHSANPEEALALVRKHHAVLRDPAAVCFAFTSEHVDSVLFNDEYTFL